MAGIGYELNAIAAVVIGGTLLSGGSGYVLGSMLGVLVLAHDLRLQGVRRRSEHRVDPGDDRRAGVVLHRAAATHRHPKATLSAETDAHWPPSGEGTGCRLRRGPGRPACTTSRGWPGSVHQTVSRVINSHPSVREDTRRRVQEAIAELGYRRNVAARTLVTRRSNTIGVITSVSPFWGPSSTLIGVERAARDAGFYLSVAGLHSIEPAAVKDVLGHFIDQGVEGIVVIAPEAAMAHMAEPFITDVPVVMVAAGAEPAPGVQITAIDQEQGARLATRHLIDLGHTSIGHIAGPEPVVRRDRPAARLATRTRRRAAPRAAGRRRLDGGQRPPDRDGSWLGRKRLPSAVFVANDLMALGFVRAMHDAGIGCPERRVDRRLRRHARRRPLHARVDHHPAGPGHPRAAVHRHAARRPQRFTERCAFGGTGSGGSGKRQAARRLTGRLPHRMSGRQRRVYRVWTVPQGLHIV